MVCERLWARAFALVRKILKWFRDHSIWPTKKKSSFAFVQLIYCAFLIISKTHVNRKSTCFSQLLWFKHALDSMDYKCKIGKMFWKSIPDRHIHRYEMYVDFGIGKHWLNEIIAIRCSKRQHASISFSMQWHANVKWIMDIITLSKTRPVIDKWSCKTINLNFLLHIELNGKTFANKQW